MKKITIEGYPIISELVSEQTSLLQSIQSTAYPFAFHVQTRWSYGLYNNEKGIIEHQDKLYIEIVIDCDLQNGIDSISECICTFLSMNKYQFRVEEDKGILMLSYNYDYMLYVREAEVCTVLKPEQLFGILTYLKNADACLVFQLDVESQRLSYIMWCHSMENIEPWGVINGFELRPECNVGNAPNIFPVNHISTFVKLMSLPIAYNGVKNLLQGYDSRTKTLKELEQLAQSERTDFPVVVGQINNRAQNEKMCLQPKDFSYMTAIWGVPGQGKSVLSISLIKQLWDKHIPSLIIEPSKHEYRALSNFFPHDVRVVNDMKHFNILVPPMGIDKYAWSEVIMTLLNMSCKLPDDSSLAGYYRKAYLSLNIRTPRQMLLHYKKIMENEGFRGNQSADFVKAGCSRLEAFFTYFNGDVDKWNLPSEKYNEIYTPFNIESLLSTPVIIELAGITTPKMKSAWVYFILQHLYAHIQQRQSKSDSLRNLLVLEEAHNILRKTSDEEVLANVANILAEARALQLGVVISDQSPKSLDPSCTSMAQNVFSFKVVDKEDREIIANSIACDSEKILDIPKFNCIVRTNFMHEPDIVKVLSKYAMTISKTVNEQTINFI